eukprot:CAMPEP_0206522502 /NCGR_PEP_ID=MMETSP0324_2-20121206/67023_1 /ASSEMBLY_ACC=CAM_ASM_000836 /TAXON_ID=2866 /ORGANISM="Crypthecodinium cohnii, Strain Seligo" /LENGTH=157 /DNA_ID=CAMNT_0054016683 /DNA_START=222 /DNA_END=691 /DNA_ORIENTATION=-
MAETISIALEASLRPPIVAPCTTTAATSGDCTTASTTIAVFAKEATLPRILVVAHAGVVAETVSIAFEAPLHASATTTIRPSEAATTTRDRSSSRTGITILAEETPFTRILVMCHAALVAPAVARTLEAPLHGSATATSCIRCRGACKIDRGLLHPP